MLLKHISLSGLACLLLLAAGVIQAADQAQDRTRLQEQEQKQEQMQEQAQERTRLREPIYGSQLMSEQEREQHRAQIRNLKTEQEREAYRLEHHKRMQARAKERGITLPDEPPAKPGRMGAGSGMGAGGKR